MKWYSPFLLNHYKVQSTYYNLTTVLHYYFQVFFPINVTETHWYLVVVNGRKGRVQVLDSMGTATRRPEVEELVRD
jgi:Ulp1 family protease